MIASRIQSDKFCGKQSRCIFTFQKWLMIFTIQQECRWQTQPVTAERNHQATNRSTRSLARQFILPRSRKQYTWNSPFFVCRLPNLCIIVHCGLVHSVNGLQGILEETNIQKLLTSHTQAKFRTYDIFKTTTHVWNLLPQ